MGPFSFSYINSFPQAQGQTLKSVGVWLSEPVFGHGQLNVAVSRVGSRDKIKFAIKPEEEGWDNLTSNVVYREVLLDAPELMAEECAAEDLVDAVAVDIDPFQPTDMDYEGPHDEVWTEPEIEDSFVFKKPLQVKRRVGQKIRSASPPKQLAAPDQTVPRKRTLTTAAHEAWVASMPDPPMEELTEEEKERETMLQRRAQFFKKVYDTEEENEWEDVMLQKGPQLFKKV